MDEIYECPQCNLKVTIPPGMDRASQSEIADMVYASQRINAMAAIHTKYKLDLIASKTMMAHIPNKKDTCIRCGSKLLEDGITNCASCSALNLNW